MFPGLTEGRIVHYVLQSTDLPESHQHEVGKAVPAIVVNTWPHLNRDDGYANLTVFPDWSDQGVPAGLLWATSRVYDESGKPGTWHWPPRA
jgi:hypothetical protein